MNLQSKGKFDGTRERRLRQERIRPQQRRLIKTRENSALQDGLERPVARRGKHEGDGPRRRPRRGFEERRATTTGRFQQGIYDGLQPDQALKMKTTKSDTLTPLTAAGIHVGRQSDNNDDQESRDGNERPGRVEGSKIFSAAALTGA